MRMRFIIGISIGFVLILTTLSFGKVLMFDLVGMTKKSTLIAIGKVTEISNTERVVECGFETIAHVRIEQTIKGTLNEKQLRILYYRNVSFEASFTVGDHCLLFLIQLPDGRYDVVQGYAGRISIDGQRVMVHHILGEAEDQTLQGFIDRIKAAEVGTLKKK